MVCYKCYVSWTTIILYIYLSIYISLPIRIYIYNEIYIYMYVYIYIYLYVNIWEISVLGVSVCMRFCRFLIVFRFTLVKLVIFVESSSFARNSRIRCVLFWLALYGSAQLARSLPSYSAAGSESICNTKNFCTCRDRCVYLPFHYYLSPCVMYERYIYLFIYLLCFFSHLLTCSGSLDVFLFFLLFLN